MAHWAQITELPKLKVDSLRATQGKLTWMVFFRQLLIQTGSMILSYKDIYEYYVEKHCGLLLHAN